MQCALTQSGNCSCATRRRGRHGRSSHGALVTTWLRVRRASRGPRLDLEAVGAQGDGFEADEVLGWAGVSLLHRVCSVAAHVTVIDRQFSTWWAPEAMLSTTARSYIRTKTT